MRLERELLNYAETCRALNYLPENNVKVLMFGEMKLTSLMSKIHLTDETVNDAVRLHKFAFIDLYHQTFKASIREAEYAWHKCRASRPGRLLALQLGAKPVSAELAQALAAAIPRPPASPGNRWTGERET